MSKTLRSVFTCVDPCTTCPAGEIDKVRSFLAQGINVNCADEDGTTPLGLASEIGNAQIMELLKQHGANYVNL